MKSAVLSLLTILSASVALAAYTDTTYVFSTKGPDTYADGTQVVQGERYALVWSADQFAGIKADGSLVNPEDEILGIFSLATAEGNCPLSAFGVPAQTVKKGGNISLWVLDTRVFDAEGKVTLAPVNGKTVKAVAGAVKTAADIVVKGAGTKSSFGQASKTAQTALPADAPTPRIKNFRVEGGWAYVTLENTASYLTFDLSAGESVNDLKEGQAAHPVTGGGEITLISEAKGKCKFFKPHRK